MRSSLLVGPLEFVVIPYQRSCVEWGLFRNVVYGASYISGPGQLWHRSRDASISPNSEEAQHLPYAEQVQMKRFKSSMTLSMEQYVSPKRAPVCGYREALRRWCKFAVLWFKTSSNSISSHRSRTRYGNGPTNHGNLSRFPRWESHTAKISSTRRTSSGIRKARMCQRLANRVCSLYFTDTARAITVDEKRDKDGNSNDDKKKQSLTYTSLSHLDHNCSCHLFQGRHGRQHGCWNSSCCRIALQ